MPLRETALVLSLSVLFLTAGVPYTCASTDALAIPLHVGPFVEKLVYRVIEGDDVQVLALMNDDVDLIGEYVDPTHLAVLEEHEQIEVGYTPRNGYGYLVIKTDKYPLNITDFRRAFAFALDKQAICSELWEGLAVPQDSCVPQCSPWSIEGRLPYTYYAADIAMGNYLLDRAGFIDVDADGWREAPDGSDFDVLVEVALASSVGIGCGYYAEDALLALGIDAECMPTHFYEYLNRLYFHGDFDMVFLGSSFTNMDVDWLAYEYWSEYADEPYWNFPCWQNATYDSWRDQLLHATDPAEVYEAAIEMQKIWVHACPSVVCYENLFLTAHRTDRLDGFVNDVSNGYWSWWNNYRVYPKDLEGIAQGGTFRRACTIDLDTFNFMVYYSAVSREILDGFYGCLYDSLLRKGPDGHDILWLAESYVVETHADNPSVPEGHTRFRFEILRNATWSDGRSLTADDVAFSLNYYIQAPGNPFGVALSEMSAAYSPSTYTAVTEFNSESYWNLHTFCYTPIIPRHVFELIGPHNWSTWNPQPGSDDFVTSGPFLVSDCEPGEFCELTCNPAFFHRFVTNSTDTTSETTNTTGWFSGFLSPFSIAVTATSSAVILVVCADTIKRRESG